MPKQPYIQFYIGDYIKDTRVLPLNVKGGWVDLILAMWDNDPKGELTGTTDDFARIMNCTKDESNLVIQTLKQKKIFAWTDLPDGQTKIISRKQKRMIELSKTRKKVGELGGNPILVNQNDLKKNKLNIQKDNLIPEYEYINEVILTAIVFNTRPISKSFNGLPEIKIDAAKELLFATQRVDASTEQVNSLWNVFKIQNLTGENFYQSEEKVYSHFINWVKDKKITNGTTNRTNITGGGRNSGSLELLEDIKRNANK